VIAGAQRFSRVGMVECASLRTGNHKQII
jgi:hypothetical protein